MPEHLEKKIDIDMYFLRKQIAKHGNQTSQLRVLSKRGFTEGCCGNLSNSSANDAIQEIATQCNWLELACHSAIWDSQRDCEKTSCGTWLRWRWCERTGAAVECCLTGLTVSNTGQRTCRKEALPLDQTQRPQLSWQITGWETTLVIQSISWNLVWVTTEV